jgi:hypothetical protein
MNSPMNLNKNLIAASILLLLSWAATDSIASQARLDLNGGTGVEMTDGAGTNLTFDRRAPLESFKPWPQSKWSKSIAVPLRPNVSQRVEFSFVPSHSGKLELQLRGPYVLQRDQSLSPVWVYWSDLKIVGATLTNPGFEGGLDGWKSVGPASQDATVGPVEWLGGARSAKVWHNASLSQSIDVIAGQRVTLSAVAGFEDRMTAFEKVYRKSQAIPVQLSLTSGDSIEGVILDGDTKSLFIRRDGDRPLEVLRSDVKNLPTWRSSLYPEDWKPGTIFEGEAFLHDFSYAGYRRGEVPIPEVDKNLVDVTTPPFSADASGKTDATGAIQRAIDHVSQTGGGVVYLPEGTYQLRSPALENPTELQQRGILLITKPNVVIRGAGVDKTFLVNHSVEMNKRSVFLVQGDTQAGWGTQRSKPAVLTADVPLPTNVIPLSDVAGLRVGDTIVIREDMSEARLTELDMKHHWRTWGKKDPMLCRSIVAIDPEKKTVTLDVPTRMPIRQRDSARLYKIDHLLTGVGFEHFSIGNVEHPRAYTDGLSLRKLPLIDSTSHDDWLSDDATWKGTGNAYDAADSFVSQLHDSYLINMVRVSDSWIRSVNSFRPAENTRDVHMLSNGFILTDSRFVTITDCELSNPQFIGGGGNGYLVSFGGPDNLLKNSKLVRGRHPFAHRGPQTSGNVIHNVNVLNGASCDWHMQLSPANLADNVTMDGCVMEAWSYRGNPPGNQHGHTTTQTVFWNTCGIRYSPHLYYDRAFDFIIDSNQFGIGYVVGTRGLAPDVRVDAPASYNLYGKDNTPEWVEGVGLGATLEPQSLYLDQLRRRTAQ